MYVNFALCNFSPNDAVALQIMGLLNRERAAAAQCAALVCLGRSRDAIPASYADGLWCAQT